MHVQNFDCVSSLAEIMLLFLTESHYQMPVETGEAGMNQTKKIGVLVKPMQGLDLKCIISFY